MIRYPIALALAATLALASTAASRDLPDPHLSSAMSAGGIVLITPAHMGDTLAEVGATITVTILGAGGVPWANYPAQDVWIEGVDFFAQGIEPTTAFCAQGNVADGNSDANGVMTFGGAIAGGGSCSYVNVCINGVFLEQAPMAIAFNSPDINGDLHVSIEDFALFGLDFGTEAFRSDLVPDGNVGLADFSRFGMSYFEGCP